ncbi:S41 family peptidase [Flavobacterium sp. MFBS3-15]|uniref:S41 family peptidase n=1 Tax=Flavobacterium sp. MFBS3-15 TaxID=2989816 RepID=UPI0022357136|nr:S41 family peptidase [Flavobacterium sp. MFBS3-15]MCW4467773.1 S41 family peptidase [Flavobacterium sp. MFBS3-15]
MRHTKHFVFLLLLLSQAIFAQNKYREDFLEFWNDYNQHYAYFEKQGIDWNKVKEIYLPQADTISHDWYFVQFLEGVVNELHNGHVSLNLTLPISNRIIPSGADVFAEKRGNKFFIADVKPGSSAESCGLKPGMEVVKFNGRPIAPQLQRFLPKFTNTHNDAMYSYALNMLLAGKYDTKRVFTAIVNGKEKEFHPDNSPEKPAATLLLHYEILDGNIGYIKINNSLGNNELIKEFDTALDALMQTKSIILDLTDTPGGGNTTVARGIMGRFTDKELPYQKHVIDEKEFGTVRSWIEYVSPRGNTYKGKLIIMAGHWTGSMGEGMVIGFDAMKRSLTVGTRMAGLLGAIYTFKMKNTGYGYQIPYERLYHVNGTPRENFVPVYLTANSTETKDKALQLAR